MASPPALGSTSWGTPLDTYMASILTEATTALNNVSTHATASDPHGDRAYALGLINPVLTGTNAANGYVKLNASGQIPNNLLPSAGGLSDVFDVSSSTFGAVGDGHTDDTTPIQNALNACASAGGGEVWIPNGTWPISAPLVIGNNTWLHLSPGATMIRKINSGMGLLPGVMLANFSASTSLSNITGNVMVTGGVWDATAGNTQSTACIAVQVANASFCAIEQTEFIMPQNNTAVQLFGVNLFVVRDVVFGGYTPSLVPASITVPAVQIAEADSAEMPAGLNSSMYSNATCSNVAVQDCLVGTPIGGYASSAGMSYGGYAYLAGTLASATGGNSHSDLVIENCAANGVTVNFQLPTSWQALAISSVFVNHGYADTAAVPAISTANMVLDALLLPTVRSSNLTTRLDVEQWTVVAGGSFQSGFGTVTGAQGPSLAYRVNMDTRTMDFIGSVRLPGGSSTYNAVTFLTLPFTIPTTRRWPAFPFSQNAYSASSPGPPRVELSGNTVTLRGIQGNLNSSNVDCSGFSIPLDY